MRDVGDFLEQLDKVEDKLTAPEKDTVDNPLDARVGDKLEGAFVVRGRLGSGSSAVVLLVEKDAKEFVLKLSSHPDHNDRLRDEAALLRKLRHQNNGHLFPGRGKEASARYEKSMADARVRHKAEAAVSNPLAIKGEEELEGTVTN